MFSVPEQGGDLACLAKGGEDERTIEKSLDVRQGQAPCGQEDTLSEITGRSLPGREPHSDRSHLDDSREL